MTMKGFDIRRLDARKRAILQVFKDKVVKDYSRFLGIPPDQIEVEIKAGSVIVIGKVDPSLMPDSFDPGDGSNFLQALKDSGGAEMVEEGMSIEGCFVDPEPVFPVDDEASAVGDPHLQFASGGTADLCCSGGICSPCKEA